MALADILPDWARVHYHRRDFRALIALGDRYLGRIEALGDSRRLAMLLFWVGVARFNAVRYDAGRPLMERALALGETLDDPQCIGRLGDMYLAAWVVRPRILRRRPWDSGFLDS